MEETASETTGTGSAVEGHVRYDVAGACSCPCPQTGVVGFFSREGCAVQATDGG